MQLMYAFSTLKYKCEFYSSHDSCGWQVIYSENRRKDYTDKPGNMNLRAHFKSYQNECAACKENASIGYNTFISYYDKGEKLYPIAISGTYLLKSLNDLNNCEQVHFTYLLLQQSQIPSLHWASHVLLTAFRVSVIYWGILLPLRKVCAFIFLARIQLTVYRWLGEPSLQMYNPSSFCIPETGPFQYSYLLWNCWTIG